jgi:hypothetical protein
MQVSKWFHHIKVWYTSVESGEYPSHLLSSTNDEMTAKVKIW